jgi:hypothetical protein
VANSRPAVVASKVRLSAIVFIVLLFYKKNSGQKSPRQMNLNGNHRWPLVAIKVHLSAILFFIYEK